MRHRRARWTWTCALALCTSLALATACGGSDTEGGGGDTEPIGGDLNQSGDGSAQGDASDVLSGDITGSDSAQEDGAANDTAGADGTITPPDGLSPDAIGGDTPDGASVPGHEPFTCDEIDNDGDGLTDEDCSFLLVGGLFGAGHALGTDNEGNALEHTLSTPTFSGTSEGGGYRLTPVGPGATP
jgi:hypothetical protein